MGTWTLWMVTHQGEFYQGVVSLFNEQPSSTLIWDGFVCSVGKFLNRSFVKKFPDFQDPWEGQKFIYHHVC